MIPVTPFSGLPVAVLGLGRAGLASARALMQGGATVWAWDDSKAPRDQATIAGVPLLDLATCNWRELTSLVLSPGVPLHYPEPHPVVTAARGAGCEIIGEVELLARTDQAATYVGITGTNGKSTTTALLGHIFRYAGQKSAVGGNLGQPALDLEPQGYGGTYILEMSSYQLDLTTTARFNTAVLLNISPDHIDRHGTFAGYVEAKKRIFAGQTNEDVAIVGVDDETGKAIYEEISAEGGRRVIGISATQETAGGVYGHAGKLIDDLDGHHREILDLRRVRTLPGEHNWQNAAAAYAAARARGLRDVTIVEAIKCYPGLPHRQEEIAGPDHIRYVNDSKATNVDAAVRALVSYDDIYWIAGGRAKESGFDVLERGLGHVRHALLIGEAAVKLAAYLQDKVPYTLSGTLDTAVRQARTLARGQNAKSPVILLSPACASFDQFENFEARGDAFRAIVGELAGENVQVNGTTGGLA
ncbi:MAG: UDP-N-acetylmuramoyl-L-alanine--D-glutamate ligase [Rhodospirillales bacterium]